MFRGSLRKAKVAQALIWSRSPAKGAGDLVEVSSAERPSAGSATLGCRLFGARTVLSGSLRCAVRLGLLWIERFVGEFGQGYGLRRAQPKCRLWIDFGEIGGQAARDDLPYQEQSHTGDDQGSVACEAREELIESRRCSACSRLSSRGRCVPRPPLELLGGLIHGRAKVVLDTQ